MVKRILYSSVGIIIGLGLFTSFIVLGWDMDWKMYLSVPFVIVCGSIFACGIVIALQGKIKLFCWNIETK